MITKEQLHESGLKAVLTHFWASAKEAAKSATEERAQEIERALQHRRHPQTIFGVMTFEQADQQIARHEDDPELELLIGVSGLNVISDSKAFFLTDDSTFGYGVLPRAFMGVAFRIPLGTRLRTFKTVQEFCAHFYPVDNDNTGTAPMQRHLATVEEIVAYVNETYHKEPA